MTSESERRLVLIGQRTDHNLSFILFFALTSPYPTLGIGGACGLGSRHSDKTAL